MGFATGLLGGVTLTTSILYLTIAIHQRNRLEQAMALRQQSLVLRNIIDPLPPSPPPSTREARVSVLESAKDLWNSELEGLVRKVQHTNWSDVREQLEQGGSTIFHRARKMFESLGEQSKATAEPGIANIGLRDQQAVLGAEVVKGREG